jgi:hypothetical protein
MTLVVPQPRKGSPTGLPSVLANRIHEFGPPGVIALEEIPRPAPGRGEVLVRVKAAGVGPWDAWIRAGKSVPPQPLPFAEARRAYQVLEGPLPRRRGEMVLRVGE